ncbi:MAG: hypothetical protein ACE5EX_01905 [Phycisphaerae bacterium]
MILRIETTANSGNIFKHDPTVEHRDRTSSTRIAPACKNTYGRSAVRELLGAVNRRYLESISALDAPSADIRVVEKVGRPARHEGRSDPGLSLFKTDDSILFQAIVRSAFTISGLRNRNLHVHLNKTTGQVSRLLKGLRLHGLIKKIGRIYKYY